MKRYLGKRANVSILQDMRKRKKYVEEIKIILGEINLEY